MSCKRQTIPAGSVTVPLIFLVRLFRRISHSDQTIEEDGLQARYSRRLFIGGLDMLTPFKIEREQLQKDEGGQQPTQEIAEGNAKITPAIQPNPGMVDSREDGIERKIP